MKRSFTLALLAMLVGSFVAVAARAEDPKAAAPAKPAAEQLRIYVEGAYCSGCSAVLAEALELGGFKKPSRISPNSGKGYVIVLGDFPHSGDLSKVALAINGANTPHKKISKPGVSLELFAKVNDANAEKVRKVLEKFPAIDAAGSTIDTKRGVIAVRLAGGEALTVETLIAALQKEGIEAKVETDLVRRFVETPAAAEEKQE